MYFKVIFTFELASHGELLPAVPAIDTLTILSNHGRMMKNLFSETSPAVIFSSITLKCFMQKWIERFSGSYGCGTEEAKD